MKVTKKGQLFLNIWWLSCILVMSWFMFVWQDPEAVMAGVIAVLICTPIVIIIINASVSAVELMMGD